MKTSLSTTRRMMAAIAGVGLVLGAMRAIHYLYHMDLYEARSLFEGVGGIEAVQVFGFDDVTYETTMSSFAIAGKPGAVIRLRGFRRGPGGLEHLYITQLGPLDFHGYSYGDHGATESGTGKPMQGLALGDRIDIGNDGDYAAMIPFKFRDMNDVVAHYDELVRLFSTWPDGNPWGEAKGKGGRRLAYCVRPTGKPPVAPPANFPGL